MAPAPKPPGARRRRNLASTSWRTFTDGRRGKVPTLPARRPAWSPSTRAWWRRLWRSPMAVAYLEADLGALERLAELVERVHRGELGVVAEVRQLEDRFGLSPKSRQLLQWQVLAGESAPAPAGVPTSSSSPATNVRRLRAVDPKAVAS